MAERTLARHPWLTTAVVAAAVAVMVWLGLWQLLDRRPAKQAYLEQLARNPALPPIAFPRFPDDRLLFRRAGALCLDVVDITRAGAGAAGYRLIAHCRTGAEGPGLRVQIGTTRDPEAKVVWRGGRVEGWIAHAPDARPLIAGLFDRRPQELLLVAATPAAGLNPNARPDVGTVPNSHLAYAVQWFFFAAVAATIYVVALRRRRKARPDAE